VSELRFVMAPDHAVGRRRVRWTSLNGHPGACRCWHADPSEALACYRGELATNPNPDPNPNGKKPDPDAPGGAGGGKNRAAA
jgi:hypothetical protein